jgi:hypothetical protein
MEPSGHRPPDDVRRRVVRYGLWRWVAAAPAVIGSLLLLMLTSGALGRGSGLLVLTWAACAAVVTTPVGERMTVRVAYRFHRPSAGQAAALQQAWRQPYEWPEPLPVTSSCTSRPLSLDPPMG